jgi:benzoyl-CoA-dihydrodiol lyase
MFCSGANIYMLGTSSHAWKVNFCKFTNETRNGLEDVAPHRPEVPRGRQRILRGRRLRARAGLRRDPDGGRPLLHGEPARSAPARRAAGHRRPHARDRQARVRRDLADIFCTTSEGVRADRAKEWKLVDDIAKPAQCFADMVRAQRAPGARRARSPIARRTPRASRWCRSIAERSEADALRYYDNVTRRDRPRQAHRDLDGRAIRQG